jgi:3',5'-cyclic-AMP phosphodiesterase
MLIAQLSDPHIRPPGQLYRGVVDSNAMFSQAIAHVHALDRRPDLVLITGDLVDAGQPEEYAHALALLKALEIPYLVLPGNHDEREAFRSAFAHHSYLPREGSLHYCVDDYAVRLIALDSCIPGNHHGHVDAPQVAWLHSTLAANPRKPTLVYLHHPPFVSGITYLDDYRCKDAEPLAEVLRSFNNIEAVLCGHVHRQMVHRWAGTVVLSCPSTTTEIDLKLAAGARPSSHLGPQACMLHYWAPGQGLVSHHSVISPFPGPYPFF